ncbi:MAG: SufE family protein [Kiloniellales bacterium]|nr:SufE family protein [Kiloniellales bacterium]
MDIAADNLESRDLDSKVEELIEDFEYLESWEDRFRYIIDLGRKLEPMDEALKTEETKVDGCTSQVWIVAGKEGNPPVLHFSADSDAHIVRGLIAILLTIYDGRTAREILDLDAKKMIARLGFAEHLSPNRANGLFAMVGRIRQFASDTVDA